MFPSRPYLVWSIALHAIVIGAAFSIHVAADSPVLEAEPVETVQSSRLVQETFPEIEDPEAPDEEPVIEETADEVPLEDPEVEEVQEMPEPDPDPRLAWNPPPRPENWMARIAPREPDPPPEPPVESPPVAEPEEASLPLEPPSQVIEAIEGQNPAPEYPALAVRRGWSGAVLLDVEVDETGQVLECAVADSSGFALLDAAAAETVRSWRFRNGPGTTRVRIEFVLGSNGARGQVPPTRS